LHTSQSDLFIDGRILLLFQKMPVDEGGSSEVALSERRSRPTPDPMAASSSSGSSTTSALASYHQHLAAIGGSILGHHTRESSAFVPVVPSRAIHLGPFEEGSRKMEIAAMMADKRKEIALREEAACVAAAHAAAVMFRYE